MRYNTVAEIVKALETKAVSSVELTEAYLDRIKKHDSLLNSFISVTEESALDSAKQADELRANGQANRLTGVPMAHKDIFCTKGIKTTCGSKMLDNFTAPYDATVVEKLNTAGMVMLGKTNMDEFAMGSSNETSFYGTVKNPWDLTTVPGGSSGGSAAAVAASLAPIATGTDTGGSIRQPAALTGLTGVKPTYGRVSRFGMIAFASSLDQGGVLAKSAEDAALLLREMSGFDEKDSTSVNEPVPDYQQMLNEPLVQCRIGLPKQFFDKGLDANVEQKISDAVKVYESLGATVQEVDLPNMHLSVPVYYVIAPAECSSNLSRYDGVRFGYRCESPVDLEDLYSRSRGDAFGAEVKRRIMMGTYALSSGYYDAYYLKAQKARQLIKNDFVEAFKQVDFIMGPTTPTPAFKLGAKADDPVSMYLSDIYTIAVNLAGLPGASIPVGVVDGLPVGLQLIGNYFEEGRLLNAAHKFQQETDWHLQQPAEFVTS